MSSDSLFRRLREDLQPAPGAKKRIQHRLHVKISTSGVLLTETREALTPPTNLKMAIWARINAALPSDALLGLFDRLRELLTPAAALHAQLWQRLVPQLTAAPVMVPSHRRVKWVASFVLVALLLKSAPHVLLAPHTVADSAVMLLPMRGEVTILIGDLWQPVTNEIALTPGMLIRTDNGEATISYHDDGVVRLAANTTLQIHDTSHRLELASELLPTFSLRKGQIWVQGLVPSHVRGLTVATSYGHVTVHEGSASIEEASTITVSVWDRSVSVTHEGQEVFLVAGERIEMRDGNVLLVKKVADAEYGNPWPEQNLARDAVHRKYIAQLQHERQIARAGILPTSRLYSMKRVAEEVAVLLTFSAEERMQKRILQAQNRLDEAAALLAQGRQEDAIAQLEEYQEILLGIATGSGDVSLAQFLIQQSLVETTAEVAAALPGDSAYPIKKAVMIASAGLSDGFVNAYDFQGELFLDALAVLMHAVAAEDIAAVPSAWHELQPYLAILEQEDVVLSPQLHKEVTTLLAQAALAITGQEGAEAAFDEALLADIAAYLPPKLGPTLVALSEEEIMAIALSIKGRIFIYNMKQSRLNQFIAELKALDGHPYEGAVLRRLMVALPVGPEDFKRRVQGAITALRWEMATETL